MAEPVTIDPAEPANKGLDYVYLKEEGIALIQQLSGDVWTDYNEHDPGVTTLEQLCYALTELSYRAEIPLQDLLIERPGGKINPRRQALFPARRIFPCNPVTENDYRKLVVDRVPEVANAWFTPYRGPKPAETVNGLYDVALYVPETFDCQGGCSPPVPPTLDGEECEPSRPDAIRDQVRQVYCRHRSLCEDVHEIRILKHCRTVVLADVTIAGDARAESVLARLLFNLGNFLAPELRRRPLKSQPELDAAPSEIFDGPLLLNGLFEDEQLRPKAAEIPVPDVVRLMAGSPGVIGVRNVRVDAAGRSYEGHESIPVPADEILTLDARPATPGGAFTIRLFRDGLELRPDPARVALELARLWADYRRTYRLAAQYREVFPFPRGRYRDLRRYYSIQNQFPRVYGIGAYGLPENSSPIRRAQARQLKGYLLVFEQMLADYFAQLAGVKDLYSTQVGCPYTYFFQYLERSVPDVEPLLKEDYRQGLRALIHSQDPADERRNRFLDFLLAVYAESLDASSVSDFTYDGRPPEDSTRRLRRAKRALLHHLVASTRDRGRGFDYLDAASRRNIAGMEIKSRIQLGMKAFDHRPLSDLLDELDLELREADAAMSVTGLLSRHADHIEEHFIPMQAERKEGPGSGGQAAELVPQLPRLRWRAVSEELIEAAAGIDNYRLGSLPGDHTVAAVCKTPAPGAWHLVDKYADPESAEAGVRAVVDVMQDLRRHCQQLYIVEHHLLRFGRFAQEDEAATPVPDNAGAGKFSYSFTITAVVSTCPRLQDHGEYRAFVRRVVRENTPAHVVTKYCFLRPWQMRRFEHLYWTWRHALRPPERRRRLVIASALLRDFLQEYQNSVIRQSTGGPPGR